jgi:ATP-dependent protease ClpP protease subunit
MEKNENKVRDLTINWERAIFVDSPIDDDLVKRLTPTILQLRQESQEPITVGIDSPGGSLEALETLVGLLKGPNQDGNVGKIITVCTGKAYSAAANLMAFGDWSVALKHSKILYHDVRYVGIEDLTPEIAARTAAELKEHNERFALRLADEIVYRLVWNYVSLEDKFEDSRKRYPVTTKRYTEHLGPRAEIPKDVAAIDMVGFSITLYRLLSRASEVIVQKVMRTIAEWSKLTSIAAQANCYGEDGLLTGTKKLFTKLASDGNQIEEKFSRHEDQLKLLLCVAASSAANDKRSNSESFEAFYEKMMASFWAIHTMNDSKHANRITALMKSISLLFKNSVESKGDSSKVEENNSIDRHPYAQLFWFFCVLVCRELCNGDHLLTPRDAQLLGLIDEVAGGTTLQSRREYWLEVEENESKTE